MEVDSPTRVSGRDHGEARASDATGPGAKLTVTRVTVTKKETTVAVLTEDELRLAQLGYKQEVKRIFTTMTTFGLAASMVSVVLGIIPLYGFSLRTGGPVVMAWGWLVVGVISLSHVLALAEICSAYPTMGAVYFMSFKLGGERWGPLASWMAGWTNLLGQVAGVASGGYAGAQVMSDIIFLTTGHHTSRVETISLFALMLLVAGMVNTFTEALLPALCYFSVVWHLVGVLVVVVVTLAMAPSLAPPSFFLGEWVNESGFDSTGYVALVGLLAAASTFTGYDTAAHVAEETHDSHLSTPRAMILPMVMALVLGEVLILSLNAAIQDLPSILRPSLHLQPYTLVWQQTAGHTAAVAFNIFVLVAIECSNCANLTSASRMVYSFARDRALPWHYHWYNIHEDLGGPVRAIWLCVLIAFCLGLPGLGSDAVLAALFSLTATGLYASYLIPIFLRVTISRHTFQQAEFNLGRWSVACGWVACLWIVFIMIVLCLPEQGPATVANTNYSPLTLGLVLLVAAGWWVCGACRWFQGPQPLVVIVSEDVEMEEQVMVADGQSSEDATRAASHKGRVVLLNTPLARHAISAGGDERGDDDDDDGEMKAPDDL